MVKTLLDKIEGSIELSGGKEFHLFRWITVCCHDMDWNKQDINRGSWATL